MKQANSSYLSIRIVDSFFVAIVVVLSLWTFLAQVAMLTEISFASLLTIFNVVVVLMFLCWFVFRAKTFCVVTTSKEYVRDYGAMAILLVLVLVGVALAYFSIRPDIDDVNYVARPVFFLEHQLLALDLNLHAHALTDVLYDFPLHLTMVIEFFWAYISWVFSQEFLDVYYYFVPVLGGALIPLAWYLALSKVANNTVAVALATAVIVAFLCIDGVTHRSFGNFAFVRIWQGKAILMTIFVPVFIAFSFNFFKSPTKWNWLKLLLFGVASTGLSSTSLFLIPSLAFCLGVGYLCSSSINRTNIQILGVYFAAFFYIFVIGIYCLVFAQQFISSTSAVGVGWPTSFTGIYQYVFGGWFTYSSFILWSSFLLSVLLLKGTMRKFMLGWIFCAFVVFLNPLSDSAVAEHLTSANNFWRLFHILPFPLTVGIPIVLFFQRRPISIPHAYGFLALIMIFSIVINIIPNNFAVFQKVEFGISRYKLDKKLEAHLREIIHVLPPGAMLASAAYSATIPMFTSKFPQVILRPKTTRFFHNVSNQSGVFGQKLKAFEYVSGRNNQAFDSFQSLLQDRRLQNVILVKRVANLSKTKKAFQDYGFILLNETESHAVYSRQNKRKLDAYKDFKELQI